MVGSPPYNSPLPGRDQSALESQENNIVFLLGLIVIVLVALTWAIVAVLGATRVAASRQLDIKTEEVAAQLRSHELESTIAQYMALDTVATYREKLRSNRFVFLPTWNNIKKSIPNEVQFTSVTMDDQGVFRTVGVAKSINSVAQFAQALQAQPDITMIVPLSVDRQGDRDLFSFSLSFQVTTGKKSEGAGS